MARKVKTKKKVVKEPKVSYKKSEFRIFHSFEESNKYDSEQAAMGHPIQNLRETVELILRTYGFTRESLNKRKVKLNFKLKIG